MSGQPMQTGAGTESPMLNTKLLLSGGVVAAVGAVIWMAGSSMAAAAVFTAVRKWSTSDQRRELQAKARTASTAASAAWKQHPSRTITLPDATPAPVRSRTS